VFDEDRVLEAVVGGQRAGTAGVECGDGVHLFETVAKHDVAFYHECAVQVFTALNSEMKSVFSYDRK
jgi:hypothetical protein